MKTLFAYSFVVLWTLACCSYNKATIYGVGEVVSSNFMGDGSTANTILGNTYVAKNSTATKAVIQGIIGLAGAIYYGKVQLANETTTQLANAGLTQVQLRALDNALKESLAAKGLEGTLAGIKAGLFTPIPFR